MECIESKNEEVLLLWYDAHGYKKGKTGVFRSKIKGYDWLLDSGRTKEEAIKEILFSWESVFKYNLGSNPIPNWPIDNKPKYIIQEIVN